LNLKLFQKQLRSRKISFAFLFGFGDPLPSNYTYLSGFSGHGILVVPSNSSPFLAVPLMEAEKARECMKNTGINCKVIPAKNKLMDEVRKRVRGRIIGIDKGALTLDLFERAKKIFKKARFEDIGVDIYRLRSVKNNEEKKDIARACAISDDILRLCIKRFMNFRTEKDVADFLEGETRKRGCSLSFPTIIASGSGASQPHYSPKDIRLRKGFCIIDFGVRFNGYCSDTTRTVFIGNPTTKEQELYAKVLAAQEESIKSCAPGKKCSEIMSICTEKLGYLKKYFIHGLGHGVGTEIHEFPSLNTGSSDTLQEGMVFTIEPGIYFSGKTGIRIEDTLFMGKTPEILTKIPKDLLTIEKTRA